MKKLLITAAAGLACVGAFGQGTLTFINNSDNLIYFTTSTSGLMPGDVGKTFVNPVSGNPNSILGSTLATDGSIGVLSGAPTFTAYLYGGTSPGSLTLQTTSTLDSWGNGSPGSIVNVNATFTGPHGGPSLPAGTAAYFQVVVSDQVLGNSDPALVPDWQQGFYGGNSPVFQSSPVSLLAFIWNPTAPVNSTWAPGSFHPTDLAEAGLGDFGFGGIEVFAIIPEPGTFALAGLGLAALLAFRRRS